MKIIFAGTPTFALPTLQAIITSPHKICAIYTQPDNPAGRGQKLTASPVKQLALLHNLLIYQPPSLKDLQVQKQLQALNADIFVDIAYGLLLPEAVLNIPKFGCINIHPSLLPRYRGAAPVQREIMAGETITGVTIMKMDAGLDTGDIYKQQSFPIANDDTTSSLLQKAAEIGAKLLLEVLTEIEVGTARLTPQNHLEATYAHKISKEEGKIDWQKSAKEIERMIRAFNPWPIAYTEIDGKYIRIWKAEIKENNKHFPPSAPGAIVYVDRNGIGVMTGDGVLSLLNIQFPGGKPLKIIDILNAQQQPFIVGKKMGINPT